MFLLKKKNSTKDKEGHYIMIEGLGYQEDIMILPVYTSNNRVSKYVKQKLIELKEETDKSQ